MASDLQLRAGQSPGKAFVRLQSWTQTETHDHTQRICAITKRAFTQVSAHVGWSVSDRGSPYATDPSGMYRARREGLPPATRPGSSCLLAVQSGHLTWGVEKCLSASVMDPTNVPARRPTSIGSLLELTPTGQPAWRGTSRLSGACSNACARTVRNRAAIRRATTAPTDQFPD
jgi:hypothetical protein